MRIGFVPTATPYQHPYLLGLQAGTQVPYYSTQVGQWAWNLLHLPPALLHQLSACVCVCVCLALSLSVSHLLSFCSAVSPSLDLARVQFCNAQSTIRDLRPSLFSPPGVQGGARLSAHAY